MTDIILGMGEVGETLFDLLVERGFDCIGIDADNSKCRNYSKNSTIKNPECIMITFKSSSLLIQFDIISTNSVNSPERHT